MTASTQGTRRLNSKIEGLLAVFCDRGVGLERNSDTAEAVIFLTGRLPAANRPLEGLLELARVASQDRYMEGHLPYWGRGFWVQ